MSLRVYAIVSLLAIVFSPIYWPEFFPITTGYVMFWLFLIGSQLVWLYWLFDRVKIVWFLTFLSSLSGIFKAVLMAMSPGFHPSKFAYVVLGILIGSLGIYAVSIRANKDYLRAKSKPSEPESTFDEGGFVADLEEIGELEDPEA
jgi:hypothetical protein